MEKPQSQSTACQDTKKKNKQGTINSIHATNQTKQSNYKCNFPFPNEVIVMSDRINQTHS